MDKTSGAVTLVVVSIGLVLVVGYVKNIVKLCHCDFKSPYKAEAVHAVGIIPPVGVVTGWINVKDGEE